MRNRTKESSIKVIDAICGAGKTSYAIQMLNDNSKAGFGINGELFTSTKKYIYVTPFLSEVERVINNTKAEFSEPNNKRSSKYEHVKKLIEDGKSIVMTHELFSRLDEDTLTDIECEGYILIMDEVANVLNQIKISTGDLGYLIKSGAIEIDTFGQVYWMDDSYETSEINRFRDIKVLAERENLFIENNTALFWTMNVKSFLCFDEVYILTYLFDGQIQKYYYDMHEIDYSKYSVQKMDDRYELCEYNSLLEPRGKIEELLNIYVDYKSASGKRSRLNSNFDSRKNVNTKYQLSGTWLNNASDKDIEQLRKNLVSYFRTQAPTLNDKIFWTTLKSAAPRIKNVKCKFHNKDDRTKDNYLPLNVRATNDYADCTSMAYVYNRFMNPIEKNFFYNRGITVDEDQLAMSDLIQFLFRGCIRKNEPMNCYIPSERMRNILTQWL